MSCGDGDCHPQYTPSDRLLPGQPGDLSRTEPLRLMLEPSGQLAFSMFPRAAMCSLETSLDPRGLVAFGSNSRAVASPEAIPDRLAGSKV
jgi:hypothetical protein